MRVTVKNNPKATISKDEVKEATKYFLTKLLGDKIKGLGKVEIRFRKVRMNLGGSTTWSSLDIGNQNILLNSVRSKEDIYRVLAHECTHVKQYFLKELTYTFEFKNGRRMTTAHWKGKLIRRSNYKKRGWEVEARKAEKMACNIEKKLREVKVKPEPVKEKVQEPVISSTINRVMELLNGNDLLNGNLLPTVLQGITDKQEKLQIQKEIFSMREEGLIENYNVDGIVWVRIK